MPLTKATTNVVNLDKDTLINGLTVGRGGGNILSNTAVGYNSLTSNTTGIGNTAVGLVALELNTTGGYNTALGYGTISSNTIGINNTAVGYLALESNTTGNNNTAVGFQALELNTTGYNNTAVGYGALDANITGYNNTAFGINTLINNTVADGNTAIGSGALQNNTTGTYNTGLGQSALNSLTGATNSTAIGFTSDVTGSNQVQLGNGSTTTFAYGAVQNRSDIRDKADVRDTTLGLEFVNALRPVDFKWDYREDYRPEAPKSVAKPTELKDDATEEEKAKYAQELAAYNAYKVELDKWLEDVKLANITHDGSKKRNRFHHGLIAQEVKSVLDAKGIDFGGFQDHSVKGGDDVLSIGYVELIAPMLKAIQELSAEVAALKAK
jgi:hypothetical protein